MEYLRIFYTDKDLVVTPSRSAKPITQVAENVTVVTAEEIEAINAHTLADVLYHVTGIQVDVRGGPGSQTSVLIQGSDQRLVQVMMDGISLNNLSDNFTDIGAFPVQQIERVEIVKGPASSAWGSSLGGVINIITKSADDERKFGGTVYSAIGERTTGDFRADASGTVGPLGYYLYGGGLTSDGLTTNTPTDTGNLYGKLQFRATDRARVQYTLGYAKGSRGDGLFSPAGVSFRDRFENFFSTLGLDYAISRQMGLSLSGRVLSQRGQFITTVIGSGLEQERDFDDTTLGTSGKFTWRNDLHNFLAGIDYDNGTLDSNVTAGKPRQEKWALFANDTVTLGKVSVTPGIRYDNTSTNGDFVSPSFGITYAPTEQTILRGYVARGFNTPPLSFTFGGGGANVGNRDLGVEEVWSYTVGVETTLFTALNFKATGFLHDINDVITFERQADGTNIPVNRRKQRRQGGEAELRTVPFYSVSLLAGYAFIDARDRDTNLIIKGIPRQTVDLGLDYDDGKSLRGALRGHYIFWNGEPAQQSHDSAVIWDLNLAKKIVSRDSTQVELFFTAHNLFNGSQYSLGFFPNPRRWFEGGVKARF
jgi:vitamin B12 transporter